MSPTSLRAALRYSRSGFSAARQIVLGVACCVLLAYGAAHLTGATPVAADAQVTECTQQAEAPHPGDAPSVPSSSDPEASSRS